MATQIISTDNIGSGVRVNLGAVGDDAVVTQGTSVVSTGIDTFAIVGTGFDHQVLIAGEVIGYGGIQLGDSVHQNFNRLYISSTGSIMAYGDTAVVIQGEQSLVTNYGEIISDLTGVYAEGLAAKVVNYGTIQGHLGVQLGEGNIFGLGAAVLQNYGVISGIQGAVFGDSVRKDTVQNFGTINGIVLQGGGDDILVNRGLINGGCNSGDGNDLFDNRGGEVIGTVTLGTNNDTFDNRGGVITGTVFGEAGSDTFCPGATDEVFDGGTGNDMLDFRGGGAVQVALDGTIDAAGNAEGDSYVSFENLSGSAFGDVLFGSVAGNTIRGNAGADTISGGGGLDKIIGGSGIDVLTGGAGNDIFIFDRAVHGGDVITDFGSTAGNDDVIRVDASTFGGGLVAGVVAAALFRARTDNLAQDADDRFIFRTTDKTLWFDIDGVGAEGPVLIADLQDSAVFTVADILMI